MHKAFEQKPIAEWFWLGKSYRIADKAICRAAPARNRYTLGPGEFGRLVGYEEVWSKTKLLDAREFPP